MKKLAMLGILLVIFSLAVIYVSSLQFQNGFSNSTILELSLGARSTAFSPFNISQNTLFGFAYTTKNGTPVDYFLINQSGYEALSGSFNSSLSYQEVNSLVGHGVIFASYNSSVGALTVENPYNGTENNTVQLSNGMYYNVFSNPTQSNSIVLYSVIERPQLQPTPSNVFETSKYGILGVGLFVIGVIAFVYSILKGINQKEAPGIPNENVDRLFASYGRKKARPKSNKRSAKRKG